MTVTWRPRDSRGHYLQSKDVHTTLGPEDWDDTCRHSLAVVEVTPTGETFGHEPVWINDGYCGGCDRCGDIEEREVCVRCVRLIPMSPGPWKRDCVDWPCTSAIVLGLEPRPAVSAA